MPELVHQHNQKQRQIFQDVPDDRSVPALPALYFVCCHDEPGPMQEEIDSGEAEQMDGTLANTGHLGSLRYSGGG